MGTVMGQGKEGKAFKCELGTFRGHLAKILISRGIMEWYISSKGMLSISFALGI